MNAIVHNVEILFMGSSWVIIMFRMHSCTSCTFRYVLKGGTFYINDSCNYIVILCNKLHSWYMGTFFIYISHLVFVDAHQVTASRHSDLTICFALLLVATIRKPWLTLWGHIHRHTVLRMCLPAWDRLRSRHLRDDRSIRVASRTFVPCSQGLLTISYGAMMCHNATFDIPQSRLESSYA